MLLNIILCLASAAALVASFPRLSIESLPWVGLVPFLLALMRARSAKHAALYGFIFGFAFFGGVAYWVWTFSFLGWVVQATFHGLFTLIFALATYFMASRGGVRAALGIAGAWCLVEGLRYAVGFTWADLGYSQAGILSIAQLAAIGGTFGIGLCIVAANGLFVEFVTICLGMRKRRRAIALAYLAAGMAIMAGAMVYGRVQLSRPVRTHGPEAGIAICQGDVRENDLTEASQYEPAIMPIYTRLTFDAGREKPDFILWPETVTPSDPLANPSLNARIAAMARMANSNMFVGTLHVDADGRIYNSALLYDREGKIRDEYRKVRLVPFGEYLPLESLRGLVRRYRPHGFYYSAGTISAPVKADTLSYGPIICFESTFPHISRKLVRQGADVLFIITNDEWFDRTAAADQHFQFSIMRAIENGVWVARNATTGASAIIDPRGRVIERVPIGKAGMIFHRARMGSEGTLYSRYGDWVFILATILYCLAVPKSLRRS